MIKIRTPLQILHTGELPEVVRPLVSPYCDESSVEEWTSVAASMAVVGIVCGSRALARRSCRKAWNDVLVPAVGVQPIDNKQASKLVSAIGGLTVFAGLFRRMPVEM